MPLASLIIIIIIAALIVVVFAVTYRDYRKVFYVRGKEASGFYDYFFARHPGLIKEPFSCPSGKETLYGLSLRYEGRAKGLIVIMHGYGLNMEHYFPQAEYLARAGFRVVLFDGVGVGRSTGRSIRGLPQHVEDASAVLDFILSIPELAALPLLLYGHSSGGYAVCAVSCKKKYPVKAILSAAGYNDALGGMKATLRRRYGIAGLVLALPLAVFLRTGFGWRSAGLTAVRGLKLADCPVLVVHSEDDPILPFKEHFEKIRKAAEGKENFQFLATRGENHNLGVPADVNDRVWQLGKQIKLDPGAGQKLEAELRELQMIIDESLMEQFLDFFKRSAAKSEAENAAKY